MKFVLVEAPQGRWRWELRSGDVVIASSTATFQSKQLAFLSVSEFQLGAPLASIIAPIL